MLYSKTDPVRIFHSSYSVVRTKFTLAKLIYSHGERLILWPHDLEEVLQYFFFSAYLLILVTKFER